LGLDFGRDRVLALCYIRLRRGPSTRAPDGQRLPASGGVSGDAEGGLFGVQAMKHMKTVQIPVTTREEVDHVTCDLCDCLITTASSFHVDEVKIEHRKGKEFPEGAYGETTSIDMCGKCFSEKLVPWLRSQGAEPRVDEWDY